MKKVYQIAADVWKDPSFGWHFARLNKEISENIKSQSGLTVSTLGHVKIIATVGNSTWKTVLFPIKTGVYVLAIKTDIRKKENIKDKDAIECTISLE
jgi:hypothetical protein